MSSGKTHRTAGATGIGLSGRTSWRAGLALITAALNLPPAWAQSSAPQTLDESQRRQAERDIEEGLRRQAERGRTQQEAAAPHASALTPPADAAALPALPDEQPCFVIHQLELLGPDAGRFRWVLACHALAGAALGLRAQWSRWRSDFAIARPLHQPEGFHTAATTLYLSAPCGF